VKPSAPVGVNRPDPESGVVELATLVDRFRSGDQDAFDEIVDRLSPRLYAISLRALGNAEAAEEAVQESWVRIYRKIGGLNDPKAFEGWAIRVTLSRIHDEFRARARERTARDGLAEIRQAMGTKPERMTTSEREDLARILREGLASLDDAHREVFILREVEGLPHMEIAKTLGIPEGTVWSRLSYARRSLREHLKRRKDDLS
jgi:RNA polymerase sigma-70 factor (ECF subfamily)